jgi:hypothetical protein
VRELNCVVSRFKSAGCYNCAFFCISRRFERYSASVFRVGLFQSEREEGTAFFLNVGNSVTASPFSSSHGFQALTPSSSSISHVANISPIAYFKVIAQVRVFVLASLYSAVGKSSNVAVSGDWRSGKTMEGLESDRV